MKKKNRCFEGSLLKQTILTKIIYLAKKCYCNSILEQNKGNPKKVWKIIQSVLAWKPKNKTSIIDRFNSDQSLNIPKNPKSIANLFFLLRRSKTSEKNYTFRQLLLNIFWSDY